MRNSEQSAEKRVRHYFYKGVVAIALLAELAGFGLPLKVNAQDSSNFTSTTEITTTVSPDENSDTTDFQPNTIGIEGVLNPPKFEDFVFPDPLTQEEIDQISVITPATDGGISDPTNTTNFVALVPSNSPFSRFCGGTRLNADWVVTAAHCVTDKPIDKPFQRADFKVRSCFKSMYDANPQLHGVERVIITRQWIGTQNEAPNDLALIHLTEPITCNTTENQLLTNSADLPDYIGVGKYSFSRGFGEDQSHYLVYGTQSNTAIAGCPDERVICIHGDEGNGDGNITPGDSGGTTIGFKNNDPTTEKQTGVNVRYNAESHWTIATAVLPNLDFIQGCQDYYSNHMNPNPNRCSLLYPNTPPITAYDNFKTFEGTEATFNILKNDYDADSDPLFVFSVIDASTGKLPTWLIAYADGAIEIKKDAPLGKHLFRVKIIDDKLVESPADFEIEILNNNTIVTRVYLPQISWAK